MAVNLILLVLSWLIPGIGFIAKGSIWRGLSLFVLINGTFALGLLLHGTVLIPQFRYSDPAFNIVSLLTFIGQIGDGGASLLTLARDQYYYGKLLAGGGWLPYEMHPWFDLASLYLLVAGSANYFAVSNFYDRYLGRHNRPEPQTGGRS
jgi:hypothetical protein